jgi:LysM repeat protein
VPNEPTCFACEREPTQQCPRCGRLYCDEHGGDVCDACLEPVSGLPSLTLYRGSLLALLFATVVAIGLIIKPPGNNSDAAFAPVVITPTQPAAGPTTATGVGQTPGTGGTATGTTTYTVQPDDTLFAICSTRLSVPPLDCMNQVLQLNGLSSPEAIAVGQELRIPQ